MENPEQQACPLDGRGEATSHEAMTQKVNGGHTKLAFSRVDNQPMSAETLKQRPEVGQLLPHRGACHQVVIQVDEKEGQIPLDRVHKTHKVHLCAPKNPAKIIALTVLAYVPCPYTG